MDEFSLYILDIAMNSVRAGATLIGITLLERGGQMDVTVTDNGCGMRADILERLSEPHFTTKDSPGAGLGFPMYKALAESTGGYVTVNSVPESAGDDHGTTVFARFCTDSEKFPPMGDMTETIVVLIAGNPSVDIELLHESDFGTISLSCREMREILTDIPLSEYEVLSWIRENLTEQYAVCERNKESNLQK